MKALDYVQDNLKKWAHEVKAFWGRTNAQGEGEAPAELLRETEAQVCGLQDMLQRARAQEEEDCPPLLPEEQRKELAVLYKEPSSETRVCVWLTLREIRLLRLRKCPSMCLSRVGP